MFVSYMCRVTFKTYKCYKTSFADSKLLMSSPTGCSYIEVDFHLFKIVLDFSKVGKFRYIIIWPGGGWGWVGVLGEMEIKANSASS
jgi:hypothetical protein